MQPEFRLLPAISQPYLSFQGSFLRYSRVQVVNFIEIGHGLGFISCLSAWHIHLALHGIPDFTIMMLDHDPHLKTQWRIRNRHTKFQRLESLKSSLGRHLIQLIHLTHDDGRRYQRDQDRLMLHCTWWAAKYHDLTYRPTWLEYPIPSPPPSRPMAHTTGRHERMWGKEVDSITIYTETYFGRYLCVRSFVSREWFSITPFFSNIWYNKQGNLFWKTTFSWHLGWSLKRGLWNTTDSVPSPLFFAKNSRHMSDERLVSTRVWHRMTTFTSILQHTCSKLLKLMILYLPDESELWWSWH